MHSLHVSSKLLLVSKFSFRVLWTCAIVQMAACNNEGASTREQTIPEYATITLKPHRVTLFQNFPATIQGEQNVEIRPKVDGYIEAIYVDEGATVKKGQLLFRVSAPQYEQEVRTAQADISIAEADVAAAEMQVAKVRPLVEKDIISKYELQSAQFALESRKAALAQSRARLINAKTNLSYTSIESPVQGVVGSIPYKVGSLVSATTTQPLTTVSNIGKIYAYFAVTEKQSLAFSRSVKGATVQERLATLPQVTLILADGTELPEKGRIETSSGIINTQTGSVSARATFPNPGNIVRSGSSGTVRLPRTVDTALLVPQKSTYEIQGKKFVYGVAPDGKVKSREIDVVDDAASGQYFVVEKGLASGDRIVLEGVASLREGAEITPITANVDSVFQRLMQ